MDVLKQSWQQNCELCGAEKERVEGPLSRLQRLIAWAKEQITMQGINEDEVVAFAKGIYDTTIAPLDIPYVPNLIEARVDKLIWQAAEALIRAAIPDLPISDVQINT